jgi:adenine-specific DNA-methyltransferase
MPAMLLFLLFASGYSWFAIRTSGASSYLRALMRFVRGFAAPTLSLLKKKTNALKIGIIKFDLFQLRLYLAATLIKKLCIMQTSIKNIAKSLKPELIAARPKIQDVILFEQELQNLWVRVNKKEREEFVKNEMKDFLQKVVFTDKNHHINIKNNIDLAVRESDESPIQIIFEVKREHNKAEMITQTDFNKKAFHELVYYFMEQRVSEENINLTYLIITTVKEWYIFDAKIFESLFHTSIFIKSYKQFKEGKYANATTDFFYNDIAKPYIESLAEAKIEATYFNLADYVGETAAQRSDVKENPNLPQDKIVNLYKILSADFLLKRTIGNDANELNQQFYEELLHIMGLEEVKAKDSGKNVIDRKKDHRNHASLMEMTLAELETVGIDTVKDKDLYGETKEEQYFAIALDLCTTWVNRVLFLKLLEGQLLNYHDGDPKYKFLNAQTVANFSELYRLFHNVLAKKIEERKQYKEKYAYVPYLNSSLFDYTDLEALVKVSAMDDSFVLPLHKSTVLRQTKSTTERTEVRTLAYLFEFLDAYDFASDGGGSLTQDENKTLINASVLGKVFEKINGYKDGSIYTPSFITMYMARESVRRAVLRRFTEVKGWTFNENESLDKLFTELKNYLSGSNTAKRKETNDLINTLRICDPAVGSGHLLVSVLNEIIAIKSELGVLLDEDNVVLTHHVRAVNDELLVYSDKDDAELFKYQPKSSSSLKIQKTLFEEKRKIIENCLFGVDLNPNSVKICRLRLWIELLKNAYYQNSGKSADLGNLETLPNIDINIKAGNSLLYQFDIKGKFETLLSGIKQKLRLAVKKAKDQIVIYHSETDKTKKDTILKSINELGKVFESIHNPRDKDYLLWKMAEAKLNEESNSLFGLGKVSEIKGQELEKLASEVLDLQEKYIAKQRNLFAHSFEWAYKFPTVLNEDGTFDGFDIIIGNPPYIQMSKMRDFSLFIKEQKNYKTYTAAGDVYCLFYELGLRLLRPNGILCYITSNKWMRAAYGESLRNFFITESNPFLLVDFGSTKVFDNAMVDVNILLTAKEPYQQNTLASLFAGTKKELKEMLFFPAIPAHSTFFPDTLWVVLSPIEQSIKQKIETVGTPLKDWDINIYRGILTGFNDAFIIDEETKKRLIAEDPKSAEVLCPILRGRDIKKYTAKFANLYLIGIQTGWTNKERNNQDPELFFKNKYPAIYAHFKTIGNKEQTKSKGLYLRDDKGDYWWELRSCVYWNDFEKLKIVYSEIVQDSQFYLDKIGYFAEATSFILTGSNLEFLIAFFNSKLMTYCFKLFYAGGGLGDGFRYKKIFLNNLPIPKLGKQEETPFINLVSAIIEKKSLNLDTQDLELELNEAVYNIYGLTETEINHIKNINN